MNEEIKEEIIKEVRHQIQYFLLSIKQTASNKFCLTSDGNMIWLYDEENNRFFQYDPSINTWCEKIKPFFLGRREYGF